MYGHGISLGVFRMVLGVGVDEAGSISGARALGGSSPMRLGGLAGCQLTGPVAETPDVDLRRSAASHHQAGLRGRCPGGAEANPGFSRKRSSRKKSYYENVFLVRGCVLTAHTQCEKRKLRRSRNSNGRKPAHEPALGM